MSKRKPEQYWLQPAPLGKSYVPKKRGKSAVRSNISARVRRNLARLEQCALERIAHRRAAAQRRMGTVAGQNIQSIARWAAANRGRYGNKMSNAVSAGWVLARSNGYVKGQRVDLRPRG